MVIGVKISRKKFQECKINVVIEVIKNGKKKCLWIRIKDVGKKLDVSNICDLVDKEIKGKIKNNSNKDDVKKEIRRYKRNGSCLIDGKKFMYAHECIIVPIIMTCRVSTPKSINFRSMLGFSVHDIFLSKEQSVIKSIINTFDGQNMTTIHTDRNSEKEKRGQKELEEELGCKFIRINPDELGFDIFKVNNLIFEHINEFNKEVKLSKLVARLKIDNKKPLEI